MRQSIFQLLRDAINAEQPVALATVLSGSDVGLQWLVRPDLPVVTASADDALNHEVVTHALALLNRDEQGVQTIADRQIFVESYPPPPTLIMVGAVHIAVELTTFAKQMGFRTVVIDARGAFATAERFAHADELVHAWPDDALRGRLHPNCAVVVLNMIPNSMIRRCSLHCPVMRGMWGHSAAKRPMLPASSACARLVSLTR